MWIRDRKSNWQEAPDKISAFADKDYAECRDTRKPISGGVLVHGSHCVRSWSTTQSVIALPIGEAELYGIVTGCLLYKSPSTRVS